MDNKQHYSLILMTIFRMLKQLLNETLVTDASITQINPVVSFPHIFHMIQLKKNNDLNMCVHTYH